MSEWTVTQSSPQLDRLLRRLKDEGRGDLERRMRRNIRTAARPVVADLRRAVMAVEVTSSRGGAAPPVRSTGLRARVAAAVTVSTTRRGVRIRVPAGRVGDHGRSLPRYLDADLERYRRWRHPVFGDREREWVQQRGQPWFFTTIHRHNQTLRRAVVAAIDEAARELTG